MSYLFKLPDVGEGLAEGEIVRWRVKEGDSVREDQILVEVLTDKATVEIPSPKTGKVLKLLAKEGEIVKVHAGLVELSVEGEGPAAPASSAPAAAKSPNGGPAAAAPAAPGRAREALATPAVRKLAQEKGVDLASVTGTGPGGRILAEDVEKAAGAPSKAAAAPSGLEQRIPLRGIRRKTAEKMAQSHAAVAQVTHMDEADATALVALREELKGEAERKGVKLTYLAFIIKALGKALKEHPSLNATLDEAAQEIVLKKFYNVGIAVNTEHGLFKPVIKDADRKDLWQLAKEVQVLADKARLNQLEPSDLAAGTFTVTNVGPIGGLFATPQVTLPEVGILGVMKLAKRPVVRDDKIVVGHVLTLCLSFDHRVLDGAEAAEFTNSIIASIENPRTLL